jgi:hypothetical protein
MNGCVFETAFQPIAASRVGFKLRLELGGEAGRFLDKVVKRGAGRGQAGGQGSLEGDRSSGRCPSLLPCGSENIRVD